MKISILTENLVYRRGFLGEHGLSLLIDTGQKRYLFDTGQSRVFIHNAAKLQVDLKELDAVILSHGHYDHCGGMGNWQAFGSVPVYVQKQAFEAKYTLNPRNGKLRYSGVENEGNWQTDANIHKLTERHTQIAEGVHLLAEIPYTTGFESVPVSFRISEAGYLGELLSAEPGQDGVSVDEMKDEQLLVVEEETGLCVFAGCAHAGIINCLQYVRKCFPDKKIHCLAAGMHLKNCTPDRLEKTICALKEQEMDIMIPMHCTGIRAIAAIKDAFGNTCILPEAGKVIEI